MVEEANCCNKNHGGGWKCCKACIGWNISSCPNNNDSKRPQNNEHDKNYREGQENLESGQCEEADEGCDSNEGAESIHEYSRYATDTLWSWLRKRCYNVDIDPSNSSTQDPNVIHQINDEEHRAGSIP